MENVLKHNRIVFTVLFIAGIVLLTGCTSKGIITPSLTGHTYGFVGGLIHGFFAPFNLIAMLFRDGITLFAQNNNGAWYAFGFLAGSGGWGFLGGKGASRNR